jgi:ubiquinone/menaquinone biosynthesis C-methylase UbiE
MDPSQKNLRDLWDKLAESYTHINESYFPSSLKMALLRKYASSDSHCLDIGIANGIYSIPLAKIVKCVDGVDISQKMLDTCQASIRSLGINNIVLHNNSAEELPFENEIFDLTFSYATLALVPNLNKAFNEIVRTLKHSGIVILDITGKNNLSRRHWEKFYKSIGQFGLNSYSYGEFENLFSAFGLQIIRIHSLGILDQWKYIKGLNKLTFIEKITHAKNANPDLDYLISSLFPNFANHYFLVLKKELKRTSD